MNAPDMTAANQVDLKIRAQLGPQESVNLHLCLTVRGALACEWHDTKSNAVVLRALLLKFTPQQRIELLTELCKEALI